MSNLELKTISRQVSLKEAIEYGQWNTIKKNSSQAEGVRICYRVYGKQKETFTLEISISEKVCEELKWTDNTKVTYVESHLDKTIISLVASAKGLKLRKNGLCLKTRFQNNPEYNLNAFRTHAAEYQVDENRLILRIAE